MVQERKVPAHPRADLLPFGKLSVSFLFSIRLLHCESPRQTQRRVHRARLASEDGLHREAHAGAVGPWPHRPQLEPCLLPGLPSASDPFQADGNSHVSTETPQEKRQQSRHPKLNNPRVGMRHGEQPRAATGARDGAKRVSGRFPKTHGLGELSPRHLEAELRCPKSRSKDPACEQAGKRTRNSPTLRNGPSTPPRPRARSRG